MKAAQFFDPTIFVVPQVMLSHGPRLRDVTKKSEAASVLVSDSQHAISAPIILLRRLISFRAC